VEKFREVCTAAAERNIPVRAYVSCVLGCPYEGYISPKAVADVAVKLKNLGAYEISLGDTIGVGTPVTMTALLEEMRGHLPVTCLAVHCHDTNNTAMFNILIALGYGVSVIDASVSGLGGCPYAPGASGNVATEDVVHTLHKWGVNTGVDLDKLLEASRYISDTLGRKPGSKLLQEAISTASKL
jgi:hydroxymethylglutaryl-CoA lyase